VLLSFPSLLLLLAPAISCCCCLLGALWLATACAQRHCNMSTERAIDMVVHHHVGSFNFFLEEGLQRAVALLEPEEVTLDKPADIPKLQPKDRSYMRFWVEEVKISTPSKQTVKNKLYPSECRASGDTYAAPFFAVIACQVDDGPISRINRLMGRLPIMLKVCTAC
jgi:DNA-directed RNA polymerase beta subunit